MMGHRPSSSDGKSAVLALVAGAVLLRLSYLIVYARSLPFTRYVIGDSEIYLDWANKITNGQLYGSGVFYRAPLYAYILAGTLKLSGSLIAVYLVQMLVGIMTLLLVYYLSRSLSGHRSAFVSLVLAALAGILPFYETKLVSATWAVFFVVLGCYVVVTAWNRRNRWSWFIGGIVFGFGVLTWPGVLAIVLMLIIFGLLGRQKKGHVLFMAAGCFLAVLPVTVRNFTKGHDIVLVSSNSGFTFYQGNNRLAVGTLAQPPEVYQFRQNGRYLTSIADQERFGREYAEGKTGRKLRPSEVSGFWLGRALGWITKHPGRYAVLMMRKLVLALAGYESPSNYNYGLELSLVWPLRFMFVRFSMLLALAAIGVYFRRDLACIPVYASITGGLAVLLLFYVTARYRILMVPGLAIIGGDGLLKLIKRIRSKHGWLPPVLIGLAVFLISRLGFTLPLRRGSALLRANGQRNLGEIYHYRAHDLGHAEKAYRQAIRIYETNINPHSLQEKVALADLRTLLKKLYAQKQTGKAEQALVRGDTAKAIGELRNALENDSGMRPAYLLLGTILGTQGNAQQAGKVFQAATRHIPDDPVILYNLALAALSAGDYEKALTTARKVLKMVPLHQSAREIEKRALAKRNRGAPLFKAHHDCKSP